MKNTLKKFSVILFLTLTFIACDKDYNTIGSDIISDQGFTTNSLKFPTLAYTKKLNPVRSNNLNSSLLGVYKDPVYGLTSADIVTQILPNAYITDFRSDLNNMQTRTFEVDSVMLYIPYESTRTGETNVNGNAIFELDSVYGNSLFNISIYKNNYFLRDLDPNSSLEEQQLYYSNANDDINFDSHTGELLYHNANFEVKSNEIVYSEIDEESGESTVTERIEPGLYVDINNPDNIDFWENILFNNPDPQTISNSNQFKNFFRGLYFKVEPVNDDGTMMLINLVDTASKITVFYTQTTTTYTDESLTTVDNVEEDNNSFLFNFNGNRVNAINNNSLTISDGDEINGDETLYLKGMEGSMAVIDLFNGLVDDNGVEVDAYDYFVDKFKNLDGSPKKLINEASLTFYVDQTAVQGQEPDRVILYDLKNNIPVVDYYFDLTNSNFPANSKLNYSRTLERDEDDNGIKYKLRLTEHVNNILLRDSTNVALGLVIASNINVVDQLDLLDSENELVSAIPLCQFLSPRGTVLHGSTNNVPEDKRIKFEIFFSEPNQ